MAIDFETIHNSFDGMMLDLCVLCGGSCEKNEITLFLPGEAEYVANKLNLSLSKFAEQYCNIVKYKNNDIYLLKVGICPFLDTNYRCELEETNSKPIRCMLYPVLISASQQEIKIFLDHKNCPMAHRVTDDFNRKATKISESIKDEIPKWWLDFVAEYDEVTYDYSKLEKFRDQQFIELSELEVCINKEQEEF